MNDRTFEEPVDTLLHWLSNAKRSQRGHYATAHAYQRRHLFLGIPVVILSTAIGTSVFATLEKDVAIGWRIATGLMSVATVILSALQTFLAFGEKSARHRQAAAG